jgi:hypothetical protein
MVSLFSGQAARHVRAALDAARVEGRVAVVDHPRLARQLAAERKDVVGTEHGSSALDGGGFGAVVAGGLARAEDWQARLDSWCKAVGHSGLIVLVDRGQATELSRRALCGGLTQIEQRVAGRVLVTSGRWFAWDVA